MRRYRAAYRRGMPTHLRSACGSQLTSLTGRAADKRTREVTCLYPRTLVCRSIIKRSLQMQ